MMNIIRAFDTEALGIIVNNIDGLLAGVDEAGRGPLAGPVIAAAVVLDPASPVTGLDDSKKLSERKRNELSRLIQSNAISWSLGSASVDEIDDINILNATMLAMQRAVIGLAYEPAIVLVDGNRTPDIDQISYALIKGDQWQESISAASILAKVERDHQMLELDKEYPQYGFSRHKGYPTKMHIEVLQAEGICPAHRKSFRPVTRLIRQ